MDMRIVAAICISLFDTVSTAHGRDSGATAHGKIEQLQHALFTSERMWKYQTTNVIEGHECEYIQIVTHNQTKYVLDWIYKVSGRLVRTRLNATASSEEGKVEGGKLTVYSETGTAKDYLLLAWYEDGKCGVFSSSREGEEKTTAGVCELYVWDKYVKKVPNSTCEDFYKTYCNHFPNHDKPQIIYKPECQSEEGC